MRQIPFNKPYLTGNELAYIQQAVSSGHLSGDGEFTRKCHAWLEQHLGGGKALLTTSCTDALEMSALLCRIGPGDEVILPSFTFVSTANAFALRGANLVFADSQAGHPNMDAARLEELIGPRTRAIVPVHYAGMACDMDAICALAQRHGLAVIEDAAQAIASTWRGKPLGSLGDMATFSFHETKNVMAGEGGALHINDPSLMARAEIVREKGTNRSAFFRGQVDKYGWVDIGSSYLPSELTAAFLYAQLESLQAIQQRRRQIWERYHQRLTPLQQQGRLQLPVVPPHASNNSHMYYIVCESLQARSGLIAHLAAQGYKAVFHYQSLHRSAYFQQQHDGRALPWSDRYSDCLVRLPLFYELAMDDVERVCDLVWEFLGQPVPGR